MDRFIIVIFTVRLVGGMGGQGGQLGLGVQGGQGSAYYNTFSGNMIDNATALQLEALGLVPWCAIQIRNCDPNEPRRMDGSCNNLQYPPRGAMMTPYSRMLPSMYGADGGIRSAKSGNPLPLVRRLRVAIMSDGRAASHRYTNLVPNFNVYVTGDITSVHDTANYVAVTTTCCLPGGREDPRCLPIEVPSDDLHLRRSDIRCLNLTRAITYQRLGCVSSSVPPERVNTAAPMLDMSILYGHDERGAVRGREYAGGRLLADILKGREWPPSGAVFCVNNEPPLETRCHNSPTGGANSVLGLNVLFIWLYRNHNAIARQLQALNPCWDDDQLYYTAKEINIAFYLQIMYYELMPQLMGKEFLLENKVIFDTPGHVDDYDPKLEPRVSIEYVIGTRWFHTLQEGRLKLYTRDGRLYDELGVVDFTLRTGALPINRTLEGITQGTFRQPCGAVDGLVDPDMGERVLGRLQRASDVLSSDIMKGRDSGLPPYNQYRQLCGLPPIKKFQDLLQWMNKEQVEGLAMAYESPDDIELFPAMLAERPMPGGAVGPILGCVMATQMLRWRRADRFWYENSVHPGSFSTDQLLEIRKITLSRIICDQGDEVDAIQPNAFLLPGVGNEMVKCEALPAPDFTPWKDLSCTANVQQNKMFQPNDDYYNFNWK